MAGSKRKAQKRKAAAVEEGEPAVRRAEEEECSDSDDSEPENVSTEDDDDDDEDAFKEVNVDFEFFDPKAVDFHGLRALLGKFLDDQPFDGLSELVDTIIAQSTVGTVMKTAEDEDPIGMVTALPLRRYASLASLNQIKTFLTSKCKAKGTREALSKAWDAQETALLLTERLMNTPPQIAPPLMQAIFDEVEWATEDEPTQELRDSFKLKQYIIATRVYADLEATTAGSSKDSRQESDGPVLVYVRPEDEFFHKRSSWSYSFPVETAQVGKGELQPWRLVMGLPAEEVSSAQKELAAAVAATPLPGAQ